MSQEFLRLKIDYKIDYRFLQSTDNKQERAN